MRVQYSFRTWVYILDDLEEFFSSQPRKLQVKSNIWNNFQVKEEPWRSTSNLKLTFKVCSRIHENASIFVLITIFGSSGNTDNVKTSQTKLKRTDKISCIKNERLRDSGEVFSDKALIQDGNL